MQLNSQKSETLKKEKGSFFEGLLKMSPFSPKIKEQPSHQAEEIKQLLDSINNTKMEWTRASMNFEYADCQESIDYYIYTIKAHEVMYEYLIKKAKEKGVRVEFCESISPASNKNT